MNFTELQADLQNLIGKSISQAKIGDILATTRSNINQKFNNPKSEVTVSELQKIENYFGVHIYTPKIFTFERQNDTTVDEKSSQFGKRLVELQAKHNFLDREMAKLLDITERTYLALVVGKKQPDLGILNRIKQNFKVSIDYLLYGE